MVLDIVLSTDDWLINNLNDINILENKTVFTNYIKDLLNAHLKKIDDVQDTRITLPVVVTKSERHSIHKMTSVGFNPVSYNDNPDERYMVVHLSKNFLNDLFKNYIFPEQEETVLDTKKQMEFTAQQSELKIPEGDHREISEFASQHCINNIMNVIQQYYNTELKNYIKNL